MLVRTFLVDVRFCREGVRTVCTRARCLLGRILGRRLREGRRRLGLFCVSGMAVSAVPLAVHIAADGKIGAFAISTGGDGGGVSRDVTRQS